MTNTCDKCNHTSAKQDLYWDDDSGMSLCNNCLDGTPRRKNFSHKACDHASTPAARKACRKARKGDAPTEIEVLTAEVNWLDGISAKQIEDATAQLKYASLEVTDQNIALVVKAARRGKVAIRKILPRNIIRAVQAA